MVFLRCAFSSILMKCFISKGTLNLEIYFVGNLFCVKLWIYLSVKIWIIVTCIK